MSEGYRDEVEREILARYEAEMADWRRKDAAVQRHACATTVGLAGFNLGMLVWNVVEVTQQRTWGHTVAGLMHGVTLLYMAWTIWPRRRPPAAGEGGR